MGKSVIIARGRGDVPVIRGVLSRLTKSYERSRGVLLSPTEVTILRVALANCDIKLKGDADVTLAGKEDL